MSIENVVPMWYQLYSAYDGTPTRSVKAAFYPLGSTFDLTDLTLLITAGYGNTCNYIPWSNFGNCISADIAKVSGVAECKEWEWPLERPQITPAYNSEYSGAFCYTREPNTSNFYYPAVILSGYNRQVGGDLTNLAQASYYRYASNITQFPLVDFDAPPSCVMVITEKSNGYGFGTYYVQGTHHRGAGFEYRFTDENKYHQNIIKNIQGMVDRDPNDPYTPDVPGGGSSEPGGGGGTWSFNDDTISVPQLPTLQAINAGFIAAYSPTLQQLNDLANFMWTSSFKTNLIKLFGEDAMAVIMGLHIIPAQPETLASSNVWLGNVNTNVQMPQIYNQFLEVDCGTIQIEEKYGAFLDYEPYTKCSLYLPYIGAVTLNTNEIMGKAVGVVYHIDVISGACTVFITADGSVLYIYTGTCATQLPITQADYSNVYRGLMQLASSAITLGMLGGAGELLDSAAGQAVYSAASGIAAGGSIASAMTNMHVDIKHTGAVTGTSGMLAIQTPYLIMTVPRICAPARQNYYKGYPGLVTMPLGTLSGFTIVDSIHLDQMPGTEDEKKELLELLTSGVIL